MSFILDALRKSENERQRDAAPNIARAPLATVRHRTPAWIWLLVSGLSLALIGLAAALWQGEQPGEPLEAVTRPLTESPAEPPTASRPEPGPEQTASASAPILSIRELAIAAPGLPAYRLELLAYNGADPSRGSAWINGQRYAIGDRIGTGPELVEVREDGVVLAFQGQRYLLSTR